MICTPLRVESMGEAPAEVALKFAAADFHLNTRDVLPLLEGEVRSVQEGHRPVVDTSGRRVRVRQSASAFLWPPYGHNEWDLSLSTRYITGLAVEAAAFRGTFDLTGLRLADLYMRLAASEVRVRLDTPNRESIHTVTLSAAGSSLEMDGLLNANFERLFFEGVAGRYRLNLTGAMVRDAAVHIRAAMCDLIVEVPRGIPVQLKQSGVLASAPGGPLFGTREQGGRLETDGRPALRISVDIAMGSFQMIEV